MELTKQMVISTSWKPVQSGIRLATQTVLDLHEQLVIKGELKFLLTGRLTQDALENIFSQIRSKGVLNPKPVQFRLSLRLVCLAQFMAIPSSGSYEADDTPHLVSFIKSYANDEDFACDEDESGVIGNNLLSSLASVTVDPCESNGFYYAVGWAVFKELQKVSCEDCRKFFSVKKPEVQLHAAAHLSTYKSYRSGIVDQEATNYLCHPSLSIFNLVASCECCIRDVKPQLLRNVCPEEVVFSKLVYSVADYPSCHFLVVPILKRYIRLRLHIIGKELTKHASKKTILASKSAARCYVK